MTLIEFLMLFSLGIHTKKTFFVHPEHVKKVCSISAKFKNTLKYDRDPPAFA